MGFLELSSLIAGILVLLVVIYDFFFTTLSGSGAGIISSNVSVVAHKTLQFLQRFVGRKMYSYSGLIVNLSVFFTWVLLVWFGLFLVYSSDAETIVNSQGRAANTMERLYFTGYVLSTLGMGNFFPTTVTLETVSSVFSFFGFIFFTSSITYFLSVSSAVINKRTLARSIQNFGKTPQKIAAKLIEIDTSYSYQQLMNFQVMLDKHVVNHQAYPIVHYYSHPEPAVCLGINIVRLDEALSILLTSDQAKKLQKETELLRTSLTAYLCHLENNYTRSVPKQEAPSSADTLHYRINGIEPANLNNRRKILGGVLKSEGFEWEDISPKE